MGFIDKEWMDVHQEELLEFLQNFQKKLVSGTNIKSLTIGQNTVSLLGSGNINIPSGGGGSSDIYVATVTVSELTTGSTLPGAVVTKLIDLRSNTDDYNLVLLPYSSTTNVASIPALITAGQGGIGQDFYMHFYYGDALYTVHGDTNDSYTVTKTEFYTANDLEATANAKALNNIMLMFDLPKSQSDFYNTDNNKHYFYVLPPAGENITTAAEFVTWLVGGSTKHLSVTFDSAGGDVPATFIYVSGYTSFGVEISPDEMFDVMCTKAENGYYKCEISMNGSGGPDWTSITLV